MPTFVNSSTGDSVIAPDLISIAISPTAGNTLIIGIVAGPEPVAISAVFDDAGSDVFNNPINTWQNLGSITLGDMRMELWGCCPVVTPGTIVKAQLTGAVSTSNMFYAEYSGVATFSAFGTTSNSGYNNLFFVGTAQNNTNVMFTMFGCVPGQTLFVGSGNIPPQNVPLVPGTQRAGGGTGGGITFMGIEQANIFKEELIAEITSTLIPGTGFAAIGVVMNGGLTLSAQTGSAPGFSDINPEAIVAGVSGTPDPTKTVHAMTLAQIAANAALGMTRPEFFYGTYVDGDTVLAPISPVDSYQYQRDELIYIYTQLTTFDPHSGWTSAPGLPFYAMYDVNPDTGKVTCVMCYHPDGSTPINRTNDGQLIVLTIAQRARDGISMSNRPSLYNIDLTKYATDKPLTQTELRTLAHNSKFGAVKSECFYMGEFINGQQVPRPVSTVDGYVYDYTEVKFMSSWLWTTAPGAFSPPPQGAHGGWSQMQRMEANIDSSGNVHCAVFFFNNTEIDPSQPSGGGQAYGRLRVFALCQRNKGIYLGGPVLGADGFYIGQASNVMSIDGSLLDGNVSGTVSAAVTAGPGGTMTITKIVIKKTLHASDSVISTTTLFSGTEVVAAGQTFNTTPVAYSMDQAHDYYVVAVVSAGSHPGYAGKAGNLATSPVDTYNIVTGDVSGNTTISSMGLSQDIVFWRTIAGVKMVITGDTAAPGFADIPINAFIPGQPVPASTLLTLAKNVKTSAYAVEFFGPTTHSNLDTIPLPVSPTDGYTYSRQELIYIWQWRTTASPEPRLLAWGGSITAAGQVQIMDWHVPPGGPITEDTTGAQIDVITIGVRSQITNAQTNNPGTGGNTPPPDFGSIDFGGTGGFVINGAS